MNTDNQHQNPQLSVTEKSTIAVDQSYHSEKVQHALYKISELASGAEDFDAFYRSLHDTISALLYAENFYIGLVDAKQTSLSLVYFVDSEELPLSDDSPEVLPLSGKSLSSLLYQSRQAMLLSADDIVQLEKEGQVKRLGPLARSWLGVPLIADDVALGVIVVQSYSDDYIYQEWHKRLLNYVSNVIATTLERKQSRLQLELKVQQRTHKLQQEIDRRKEREATERALLVIAELANSGVDLNEFYYQLHQTIGKLIYAENFYVALKQENIDQVRFVYYVDTQDFITLDDLSDIPNEQINSSLTGYLFRAQKPLLLSQKDIEKLDNNGEIIRQGPPPLSWLGIPLAIDDQIIGVLALQSYQRRHIFRNRDKKLMEFIAKPVATAIHRKTSQLKLEQLVKQRTIEIESVNKQLIQQVIEKTQAERFQSALYEIAKLATGVEDMAAFYQKLHQILGDLFYAENFCIALTDENKQLLVRYHADLKETEDLVKQEYIFSPQSLAYHQFNSKKPLLIHRNQVESIYQRHHLVAAEHPFISWLSVPLRENSETIGVMILKSYLEDVIYVDWHMELLEYVSNQVALSLSGKKDRANLESKVAERTLKLEQEIEQRKKSEDTQAALYFIANLANMDLEMSEFYHELHQIIGRLVYCENFFIGLKNEQDESFSIVYYVDTMDDYNLESISEIPVEKLRKSLTYYVMSSEKPLLANNQEIKALTKKEGLDVFGVETVSWLGVPLIIDNAVIGMMVLQSYRQDQCLTEQDKELMIFVAQHIATALQRKERKDYLQLLVSRRTEELKLSNENLKQQIEQTEKAQKLQTALYQIADLASSTEDMDDLYIRLHKIISSLVYAKNFFIALYDDTREKLNFVYFVDTKDELNKDTIGHISAADISHSFTGYVLKTGKPYLKRQQDAEEHKQMGIRTIGKQACYWLGVPLKIDNDIIGIIVVQSYDENIKLDSWHQELLEFVSHHVAITLERKQAQRALEKRVEERTLELAKINNSLQRQIAERKRSESVQAALYNIANLSNENMPLKVLFEKIHHLIGDLIYAANFYIALWDEQSDDMDWVYFIDSETEFDQALIDKTPEQDRKKNFARYIVKTAQPILLDKIGMQQMVKQGDVCFIGPPTEYFLGVPLVSADHTLGAMAVQSYNKDISYSQADQELMKFVAQSIVSTIERREQHLQLEQRVNQRTEELMVINELLQKEVAQRNESENLQKALFEISETPQQCTSERELYGRLHEILERLMYVESLYIALVDTENKTFNIDYIYDNVDKNVPTCIPMGNTLTSYVYRKGSTVHINNAQIHELEKRGEIDHLGTYSVDWIGVPLISGGSIYGIMILQSYDERYIYTDREVDLLNFVSTHIAEALQRKNTESRLRQTYAELAMKTKKAEAASRAKSSFLATVSHEIRTPMNGILGLLSLMSDTSMSRRQRDYVSKISTSANSLLGIINDILDYSKIEQGKLEFEHIEFDLLETLDNLVDLFSGRINEKEIDFTIDVEPNVELLRVGDALRLSQVLINLVGNAIKFTDSGYVKVVVKEDTPGELYFSVEDTGIGIAPEQRAKIFDSFTQADDTTTRKFGGSGLGLSISQQLVKLMKGEIKVEGIVGAGSCFSFNVHVARKVAERDHNLDLSGVSILLVSDHEQQTTSWCHFCDRFNLPLFSMKSKQVIEYESSKTAIPQSVSHIFVDECGPAQLGFFVLEKIRELINFKTPCYMLANPSPHMSELPDLGSDVQFIAKPNKMSAILSLLQHDYDAYDIVSSDSTKKSNIRRRMRGRKVLVAEDNLINQQVAKEILQKSGALVTLVDNGALAVEAVKNNDFDVVLMDMQMPVMDGYKAAEAIRQMYPIHQLPIIAMTANVMKGDREKCLSYGMNDYIGKPIDRVVLFKTIEQYVGKVSAEERQRKISDNTTVSNANASTQPISVIKETPGAATNSLIDNELTLRKDADILQPKKKAAIETNDVRDELAPETKFELQVLADRFDSMDLAKELIAMFYRGHKDDDHRLQQLLAQNELDKARSLVHKLKGSAGELGIIRLHQISQLVESTLREKKQPDPELLAKFSQQLSSHLKLFNELTV